MTPQANYKIDGYFMHGKTYSWAKYVDNPQNGGNNNNKVDGNEVKTFIDIIKHRYGYDYSFARKDSEQSDEIGKLNVKNGDIKKNLYLDGSGTMIENGEEYAYQKDLPGAVKLGLWAGDSLDGYTTKQEKRFVKDVMQEAIEYPVSANKRRMLKDILLGYNMSDGKNGFFEQIGTEYGSKEAFTNGEVLAFLKAIMDSIPEKDRYCDDFGTIQKFYDEYSKRDPNEKFENKGFWNNIGRLIGCDKLDNLDEAVMNVL